MPDHWQETTLGEAADVEMGQSPPGDTYNTSGDGLPFLQGSAEFGERFPKPDRWCSAPTRVAEPGDLLVSVRAPVGDTNFADTQIAFGRGLARVRSRAGASSDFLRLLIEAEVTRLNQNAGGGMFASITAKNLRGFSISLPPPIEQRRIVDLVGSIDTYIDSLETQIETSRSARSALLSELLSNPGDDWQETTLGEVAEASWGNTSVTKKAYVEAGYTAFSASGPDGCVEWFEHSTPGVVLSAIGALCGKTWFATGHWTPIKNTIWFRADSDELTQWLYLATSDPTVWPKRGQAQPFIALGDVRSLEIVIPPRAERSRQVDLVNAFSTQINALESQVESVRALRSGVLSELLSGERLLDDSYDMAVGL